MSNYTHNIYKSAKLYIIEKKIIMCYLSYFTGKYIIFIWFVKYLTYIL